MAVNDLGLLGGAQTGALYSTFDGQDVGVNDVLMRCTYFGDADLDGTVTTNDYFQIDNGFLGSRIGWINGDFDYDGAVTTNDYFLIDNAFLDQGSALVPANFDSASALSGVTAVPEAASLGVFALAAAGLRRRRRRNRSVFQINREHRFSSYPSDLLSVWGRGLLIVARRRPEDSRSVA